MKAPTLAPRPLPGLSSKLSTISFGDPGHQFENHWSISQPIFSTIKKGGGDGGKRRKIPQSHGYSEDEIR